AHDCSEGGLAVALAECCMSQQTARETHRLIGATVDLSEVLKAAGEKARLDALLFGESQGRILITTSAVNAGKVLAQAKLLGINARRVGTVGGSSLQLKAGECTFAGDLRELHDLWWNAIARAMTR
ncbi:MAG TPA: AIR synthase-related protein, partial [Verrucomicrobiota bacterium]|nr:AIR synthase-related protein [Verrucomicrobiota bacterium]